MFSLFLVCWITSKCALLLHSFVQSVLPISHVSFPKRWHLEPHLLEYVVNKSDLSKLMALLIWNVWKFKIVLSLKCVSKSPSSIFFILKVYVWFFIFYFFFFRSCPSFKRNGNAISTFDMGYHSVNLDATRWVSGHVSVFIQ